MPITVARRRGRPVEAAAATLAGVNWQWLPGAIDAAESWLVGLSFWAQVPLLLVVLIPACWFVATAMDRMGDLLVHRWRSRPGRSATVLAVGAGPEPGDQHPPTKQPASAGQEL